MDIEWAKDGVTGELFILQARPETVHTQKEQNFVETYKLSDNHGAPLVTGRGGRRKNRARESSRFAQS